MADNLAAIKLQTIGADLAKSELEGVGRKVDQLGTKTKGTAGIMTQLGAAALKAAGDFARASNDSKPINFGVSADTAKRFEDQVTRMAVATGRSSAAMMTQFRNVAKDIGVLPDRVANVASSLTKSTGNADAGQAIADIANEANDSNRSIEETAEIASVMYNKLGVSIDRVGESFARIKGVARDFQVAGGHIELENTLARLAPQLSRFEGGVGRAAATVAVLSKGTSLEVGRDVADRVMGAIGGADSTLLFRKMRELKHDSKYIPYTKGSDGKFVLKKDVLPTLQKHFRNISPGAGINFFGRTPEGVQAYDAFINADFDAVDAAEERRESTTKALRGQGAVDLKTLTPSQRDQLNQAHTNLMARLTGTKTPGSAFAATAAGQRTMVEAERADVALDVGETVQAQRDKRNALYKGRRGAQAAVDTAKSYLPSSLQIIGDIAEAGLVEARTETNAMQGQDRRVQDLRAGASTPTVRISPADIKALVQGYKDAQPPAAPTKWPAAEAVENAKAIGRSAANY
jgi:hypothetical protein